MRTGFTSFFANTPTTQTGAPSPAINPLPQPPTITTTEPSPAINPMPQPPVVTDTFDPNIAVNPLPQPPVITDIDPFIAVNPLPEPAPSGVQVGIDGNDPTQTYAATAGGFSISGVASNRGIIQSYVKLTVDGNDVSIGLSGGETPVDVAKRLNEELLKIGYVAQVEAGLPIATPGAPAFVTVEKLDDISPIAVNPIPEPQPAGATEQAARAAAKATAYGYDQVKEELAELKHLGTVARFSAEGLRDHNLAVATMEAALGGKVGVDARIGELQHLLTVALMTQEGYENVTREIEALSKLSGKLEVLEDRMDELGRDIPLTCFGDTSGMQAEYNTLKAYLHGDEHLAKTAKDARDLVMLGRFSTPEAYEAAALNAAVLDAALGGYDKIADRRHELGSQFQMSPFEEREFAVLNSLMTSFEDLLATTDDD